MLLHVEQGDHDMFTSCYCMLNRVTITCGTGWIGISPAVQHSPWLVGVEKGEKWRIGIEKAEVFFNKENRTSNTSPYSSHGHIYASMHPAVAFQ